MKPNHYARKLRQLHHLERLARKYSDGRIANIDRDRFIRKFRRLVSELRNRLHSKWWMKSAVCIAMYLQVSIHDISGQSFGPPVQNPFGIEGIIQEVFYKAVDLDGDGDQDIIGFGLDYGNGFEQQYFENIGTPQDNQFAPPVNDVFGIDLSSLENFSVFSAFADMDDDGDLDLIWSGYYDYYYNQVFAYMENTGNATAPQFTEAQFITLDINQPFVELGTGTISLADIDNDGDFDLLSSVYVYQYTPPIYGFQIVYYENVGTAGAFEFADGIINPFGIEERPESELAIVDFGDIDGDGDIDILASVYSYGVDVARFEFIENTGTPENPQFAEALDSPFGLEAGPDFHFAQLVDFDVDGDLDILSTSYGLTTYETGLFYFENTEITSVSNHGKSGLSLSLYPNPAQNILRVDPGMPIETGAASIQIFTPGGELISQERLSLQEMQIDISKLPSGPYIMQITTEIGQSTRPFVKHE